MQVSLLLCIYVVSLPVLAKKYDIEVEAMKLYGDDLSSVLARFRRTPEYLEFLKFHLEDLKKERDETAHYLLNVYHKKLMDDIDGMFGVNKTRRAWPNFEENMNSVLIERWEVARIRIAGFDPNIIQLLTNNIRRADENEPNATDSEEAIRKLDSYHLLHSVLTVDERNNFRDHGFKTAGELVHALIKSVGPEQANVQSTRQPWGAHNSSVVTSTEHSHQVTRNSSTITIYANALNMTGTKKPMRAGRMRQIHV